MGQARLRGTYEERVATARRIGRPRSSGYFDRISALFRQHRLAKQGSNALPQFFQIVLVAAAAMLFAMAADIRYNAAAQLEWILGHKVAVDITLATPGPALTGALLLAGAGVYALMYGVPRLLPNTQLSISTAIAGLLVVSAYTILVVVSLPWPLLLLCFAFAAKLLGAIVYHFGPLADTYGIFKE